MPSDYAGVVSEPYDDGGAWKQELARELEAAGYEIDWSKAMRRRFRCLSRGYRVASASEIRPCAATVRQTRSLRYKRR